MIGRKLISKEATDNPGPSAETPGKVSTARISIVRLFRGRISKVFVAAALFMVVFFATTDGCKLNLYDPIVYWGDALEMASYLGRDYVFNDLRERFFAPFGVEHASPLRYVLNFLFQANSTLFLIAYSVTRDIVAALNLYYLSTFPLVFFSAYWVYGRLNLVNPFRFGAATLYALMPFHFERNVGHLMESSYFLVPILTYIVILVFTARPYFHVYTDGAWRLSWKEKRDWICLAVVVFLVSLNEYHQLFFMMLLGMAGLASSVRHRNFRILLGTIILLAAAGLSTMAKISLNNVIAEPGLGLSLIGAPISGYGGAERFGLKMIQVILPVNGHAFAPLRTIRATYDAAHEVNENSTVALGLFGAVGFVYLFIHGVVAIVRRTPKVGILHVCSLLTLCCVLIATIGGISSVVATASALLIGPESMLTQVRSYNRIIVFIAFLSYYTSSVLVRQLAFRASAYALRRWPRKAVAATVWLPIFGLALWDQVPFTLANSEDGTSRYASDKKFFSGIESQLAPRSQIFQYPFNIHHYEVNRPGRYPYNYADGIRPYLNSQTLRFTYGGDRGSDQIAWLEATCALPPQRMVQRLCEYGFSGIVVHRKLFATPAAALEFEIQLSAALALQLRESEDRDFSFVQVDGFCIANGITKRNPADRHMKLPLSGTVVETIDLNKEYPVFLAEVSGLSGKEPWGRWTDGPVAKFHFKQALPRKFTLEITANAFGPNNGAPVKVRVGQVEKTFMITTNKGDTYSLLFETDGSAATVEIFPPNPISPYEIDPRRGDMRQLGLALISITIKE